MFRLNRLCCFLAASLLAFSAVAMAGHSAIHEKAGAEQCLMCASHADPHDAGPATAGPVPVDPGFHAVPGMRVNIHLPGGSEFTPQPRAPPVHS